MSPGMTQEILKAAASCRPVVLLGDAGVGKTTFIHRLINVDAKEIFGSSITFYIDFGLDTTTRISAYIVKEMVRILCCRYCIDIDASDFIQSVYSDLGQRFDASVLGQLKDVDLAAYTRERINAVSKLVENRSQHLQASLVYLRNVRHSQIVVFLDNVDQRSDEDQECAFLISNGIAQNWPATVFVTLRPDTFHKSVRSGTLSAYQPRVFTIPPPHTDTALSQWINFALA